MKEKKIRALVEEAKESPEAFGKLYDILEPRIYTFIISRVINPTEAEDLTACTFEKALRGVRNFNTKKGSFVAWLYRIANNVVIDHMRHEGYFQMINLEEAMEKYPFHSNVEPHLKIYYLKIIRLINELHPKHQEVLVLKFLEGKSNKEISQILEYSDAYISTRVCRALKALRQLVDDKGILEELMERTE